MNQTKLAEAQADHQAKQSAVNEAEVLVAEAAQLLVLAEAATMSADAKTLDRAITAAATAAARVEVLTRRAGIARDRLALAAEGVRAEELLDLKAASAAADAALAQVDAELLVKVPELVSQLHAVWVAAQLAVDQANEARAATARGLHVPVQLAGGRAVEALVSLPGTRTPNAVASTASLIAWINAAPARAAEQRARDDAKAADKAQRDLAGEHGRAAQESARIAAQKFFVEEAGMTLVSPASVHVRPEFNLFGESVA